MRMTRISFLFCLFLTCMFFPSSLTAQEISFTFNPPDSTRATEYTTKVEDEKAAFGETSSKCNLRSSLLFEKSDTNIIITSILHDIECIRDGEIDTENEFSAMQNVPFVMIIDSKLRLDSLANYEEMRDSMITKDPYGAAEYMPETFDYEPVIINASRVWKNHIADFHGKTAEIGDTWTIVDTINNLNFTEIVEKTITFTELIEYNDVGCVVIEFEHLSELRFTEYYEEAMGKLYLESEEPTEYFELLGSSIKTTGKWIIDPATMLYYYEHTEDNETLKMNMYGGMEISVQSTTVTETRTRYQTE
ncbi:MAG: hypothetical protein GF310_08545 [candidate division Zixibacteria bacterium]|nr:hypothetical protein [candidate division Zixibacteria bacterium]